MNEEVNDTIIDIINGALPLSELPAFIVSLVAKAFWPLFALIMAGVAVVALVAK